MPLYALKIAISIRIRITQRIRLWRWRRPSYNLIWIYLAAKVVLNHFPPFALISFWQLASNVGILPVSRKPRISVVSAPWYIRQLLTLQWLPFAASLWLVCMGEPRSTNPNRWPNSWFKTVVSIFTLDACPIPPEFCCIVLQTSKQMCYDKQCLIHCW